MSTKLHIKNLTGGYNHTDIVKKINLVIEKGTLCGLIGENGSGKTTFLNTIYGFTDHRSGEIYLNGQNLLQVDAERIKKLGIMYGVQNGLIFESLTVHDHLVLFADDADFNDRLNEFKKQFPEIVTLKKKRGGNLSGGERRLLTLALMNVSSADFWLLDEPVAGLSEERAERVKKFLLYKLTKGIGILIIEHKMNFFLDSLDHLYEMREGELREININAIDKG
jgi:ABC-type branched-subunit amino acid transport system ATPase component